MTYPQSEGGAGQALRHRNTAAAAHADDWKTRMIATYQQHRQHEGSTLRITVAQRVRALIGREVNVDAIWVDPDERAALVTVDGLHFRYERTQLVMFRPCALCGGGQFASPPLTSQADIGYALSVWQPRHPQCQPDDPVNWLDAE
jgi:hypothetical protein